MGGGGAGTRRVSAEREGAAAKLFFSRPKFPPSGVEWPQVRRDYHQSFVQPDFRAEKKRVLSGGFLLIFQCLRPKRTLKKSARNLGHQ